MVFGRVKRVGLALVALDLAAGVVLFGVVGFHLHAGTSVKPNAPRMGARQLERLLDKSRGSASGPFGCSRDLSGRWDYVCVGRGVTALYDVSATGVTVSSVVVVRSVGPRNS